MNRWQKVLPVNRTWLNWCAKFLKSIWGGQPGWMKFVFYVRPHPGLLPQEKEKLRAGFGFADERPANPVARISKQTENDSPSPWGEGRDEGGREPFEIHNLNSVLETAKGIHFLNSFWMDD